MTERPIRRSLFFVPGDDRRKLEKSREIDADTLLLDLEDAVAIDAKGTARESVGRFLSEGDFGGSEPAVRLNAPDSSFFDRDLEMALSCGASAIMVPKSQSVEELAGIAERALALESLSANHARDPVRILALVETAAGIVRIADLPAATPRVEALCFGHADFSRDMGLADPKSDRGVLLHARCQLSIAARASDVAGVDTVFLDVRDDEGFRADARLGAELGFEGKLCIHPRQVAIANEVHTPSAEQVEYAGRVVEAARQAKAEGKVVFTVDGKMVDTPLIKMQQRVLTRARRFGLVPDAEEDDG